MAKKVSNVSFRIDTDIKNQADILFSELGLSMTAAFNIFLRQSIREGGIPFYITKIPNKETITAMLEAEQLINDPNTKRYTRRIVAGIKIMSREIIRTTKFKKDYKL